MTVEPLTSPAGYPRELESDVLLADGRVGVLRPILPKDAVALRDDLGAHLSEQSVYFRFFTPRRHFTAQEFEHFANVDYASRLALVALVEGELVAVARYERIEEGDEAEVAFTVRDDQQGRGLGMVLLEHLASAARARGISRFVADTLAENHKMIDVFRRAGFEEEASFESGVVHVTLDLQASARYLEQVEERDRVAAVRSIERLLRPASIAVIGASRRPGTVGYEILANLVEGGFRGSLHPVNPAAKAICGLPALRDVREIPGEVDLAVVAVPAPIVAEAVRACGEKGVGGLVVVTAGFAETGSEGARAERELVATARAHGMRLIGPNCLGVVNTAAEVSMNATFSPVRPVPGHVAFSSQSGGLGVAILNEATSRDLGVSLFVSVGNKADVSGNDLIRYFDADENTSVILLHLESFGNPRHFASIARKVARTKPIVAVKSGRSLAGTRGAVSHTAAIAAPDAAVDALFRQAGVIRVDTLEELFEVAEVLSHQPLPAGPRVAIVANAGGPGVLAADACEGAGLVVPELSKETQARLRVLLTDQAAVSNPVDCIATVTPEQYGGALEIVLEDESVDAVIAIFTPPLLKEEGDVAAVVARVSAAAGKPVLANFLSTSEALAALRSGPRRVPWFTYPESAARALGHIVPYAAWRARPDVPVPAYHDIDVAAARAIVDGALELESSCWLPLGETLALLAAYGLPCVGSVRALSARRAAEAARRMRVPVALKLDLPGLVNRSEVGGVRLNLSGPKHVEAAAAELLEGRGDGASVIVQPMVAGGVETIVGVVEEAGFGPLVMFGLAGGASELLGDRALSLVPISRPDAVRLIASLRAAKLLSGYRGVPPADISALADVLCRVAQLAEELPEVVEMNLNPVMAGPDGAVIIDPKVRVARVEREPELRRRQLRD